MKYDKQNIWRLSVFVKEPIKICLIYPQLFLRMAIIMIYLRTERPKSTLSSQIPEENNVERFILFTMLYCNLHCNENLMPLFSFREQTLKLVK